MKNEKPRLPHIVFETTSSCNLKCLYCYNVWKRPGEESPGRADYGKSIKILKRFFKMAQVAHVSFSGGEPFLSPRFPELVMAVRLSGKSVSIVSNGNGGTGDLYRQMKELGVGLLEFPVLCSDPMVHDHLTGVSGSWAKSVDSLEKALSIGIPVAAVIILTSINTPYLYDTLEFLKIKNVPRIMINRFNIGGSGIENRDSLFLSPSDLLKIFPILDKWAAENRIPLSSNVCIPRCIINPDDFPHIKMTSCSQLPERLPITLDFEGNVRLCNHSPVILGNVWETTVKEMFSSPYVKRFAQTIPRFCKGCKEFNRCLGGCRSAGEQLWGSLEKGDPLLEEFQQ